MKSLTIKTRLLLLVGSLLALLVIAASFLVFRMNASNVSLGSLYNDRVISLEQLKHASDAYNDIVDIAHKAAGGSLAPAAASTQVKAALAKGGARWKDYLATELDEQERTLAQQASALIVTADAVTGELLSLLDKGDVDGLRTLTSTKLYPAMDPLADTIDKLALVQLDGAGAEYHAAQKL